MPILGALAAGLSARLAADPNFTFKLGMECLNDAIMISCVNLNDKGFKGYLNSLDFIIAQTTVSLMNDSTLVFLLAPTVGSAAGAASGPIGRLMATLPAHIFAKGNYTLAQRVQAYFFKMGLYGCIGTCTGFLGTTAVNTFATDQHTVVPKSCFARSIFMGFSANTRYNLVNGLDASWIARSATTRRSSSPSSSSCASATTTWAASTG